MFQGRRIVTKGVVDNVPLEVQMFLWSLIDNLAAKRTVEPDYLQVFELYGDVGKQQIIHSQEVPEYHAEYVFDNVLIPLNIKIYAIDDQRYSTMLLPEEC